MERLVADLLRLARLDAGQEPLDLTSCDTRAVAESVASDLAPSLQARAQSVAIDVAPGAERVRADPTRLRDALRNLVANASSYSPDRSSIAIRAARAGDRIELSVLDEGPGIPDEHLPRIFERFYRVDRSRTRDPAGTGLCLAIVKHLIELHGGEVRAQNRPEGGALFTISLPAHAG